MTIRWGILGCGDVAEVKSGPGFQQASGSRLTAVMRRNGTLAEDFARRHNVPRWYDRADALIQDPEVDAVYIGTPPGSHLHYALQVCAAGKPAYVEKPMARSAAECERMTVAFREAGVPLFVAYYRRALPRFLTAKELLDSGRLGRLTGAGYRFASPAHIEMNGSSSGPTPWPYSPASPAHIETNGQNLPWRLQAEQSGGGLFLDLGCHTLDILDFLLGPLQEVVGAAANLATPCDVEDAVAMQFRAPTGALGTASWNFAAGVREDCIEITGTEGRLTLSTFGSEPLRLETAQGREEFARPNPPHIQQPMIQTIVDQLNGTGDCASTGESGLRTARVMDTVLAGYYGGRDDAFWNRPQTWPGRRSQ